MDLSILNIVLFFSGFILFAGGTWLSLKRPYPSDLLGSVLAVGGIIAVIASAVFSLVPNFFK